MPSEGGLSSTAAVSQRWTPLAFAGSNSSRHKIVLCFGDVARHRLGKL